LRYLDRLLDLGLALSVIAPSIAIFQQVVLRYVFDAPSSWLDEFAVLAFAWMTVLGAAVVQRTDSHMSIDFLARRLPRRGQAALYALRFLAAAVALAVLFWQGLQLTMQMSFVEYPAMEISRGFLYAVLPVCAPFVAFYLVMSAVHTMRAARAGKPIFGARVDAEAQ
jgi:TRAP-type C4-dicarboxylate transport system permease small subunit